jgi:hypothetical protein
MHMVSHFLSNKIKTLVEMFHTTPKDIDYLSLRILIDLTIEALGEFEEGDERQFNI